VALDLQELIAAFLRMGSDVAAVPVLRLDSIAGEELIQAVLPALEADLLTTSSRETKAERPALLANVGATLTSPTFLFRHRFSGAGPSGSTGRLHTKEPSPCHSSSPLR
jgi:hypothetical protein